MRLWQIARVVWLNMTADRTCPTCGTRDGIPKSVTAVRRMIQLALVCRTCRHVWIVEWPDKSPAGPYTPVQTAEVESP